MLNCKSPLVALTEYYHTFIDKSGNLSPVADVLMLSDYKGTYPKTKAALEDGFIACA